MAKECKQKTFSHLILDVKIHYLKILKLHKVTIFYTIKHILLNYYFFYLKKATIVLQLLVVGVWNTQLSIPTNVYLKIQMFVSKAKEK